jgi:hypothetical protein
MTRHRWWIWSGGKRNCLKCGRRQHEAPRFKNGKLKPCDERLVPDT